MPIRDQSITTRLKRKQDGTKEMVVPEGFAPWRLGQRVWIRATCGRIEVTPTPRGRRGAQPSSSQADIVPVESSSYIQSLNSTIDSLQFGDWRDDWL